MTRREFLRVCFNTISVRSHSSEPNIAFNNYLSNVQGNYEREFIREEQMRDMKLDLNIDFWNSWPFFVQPAVTTKTGEIQI